MTRYDFTSDNTAGVPPEVIESIVKYNTGFVRAYGMDPVTERAADLVRNLLDADVEVFFVAAGTAANSIALASLCSSFEAVLSHQTAHLATDETGAPAFFGNGLGIVGLAGTSGKIDPEALKAALAKPESAHQQTPRVLSITNPTEYGTVYTVEQIRDLTDLSRENGLSVHIDGARFANAVAAGFDPKAVKSLGVDILVLGGAKVGMPGGEAIVLFKKQLAKRFRGRLKQAGQLLSKARFLTAPWVALLENGGWLKHAQHSNEMAARLASTGPFELAHPVQTNAVFLKMDEVGHQQLSDLGWVNLRFTDGSVRFMCSWATTDENLAELVAALKSIGRTRINGHTQQTKKFVPEENCGASSDTSV